MTSSLPFLDHQVHLWLVVLPAVGVAEVVEVNLHLVLAALNLVHLVQSNGCLTSLTRRPWPIMTTLTICPVWCMPGNPIVFRSDIGSHSSRILNLSIVAQTLMSACMPDCQPVSKEAPSHRLLFARDINDYKLMISDWYERVQRMPQVTDQDLNCFMHGLSQRH